MMTEISIHALLAESDTRRTYHKDESQEFLSTLSLRRATGILAISLRIVFAEFLSTLSLRRATAFSFALLYSTTISIHALLAESDLRYRADSARLRKFLSTLSLRRATGAVLAGCAQARISIHALLAESDLVDNFFFCPGKISIHALLAESDWSNPQVTMNTWQFLSTLSLRRATPPFAR